MESVERCDHTYALFFKQKATHIKLEKNLLSFECIKCKKLKKISAKFLLREARYGRTYLMEWEK